MKFGAFLVASAAATSNSFQWQTGTVSWAQGYMGFTLYDDLGTIIFNRPVTYTRHNEQDNIVLKSEITEIVFSGTSDGFHGAFTVTDSNGSPKQFHCTNCLSSSTTMDLNKLYIDTDGSGSMPDTANCNGSCRFVATIVPAVAGSNPQIFDANDGWQNTFNWAEQQAFCENHDLALCQYKDICPDGVGEPPILGRKPADYWVAFEDGDGKNFAQIGTWGSGNHETCTKMYDRHYSSQGRTQWETDPVREVLHNVASPWRTYGYCCDRPVVDNSALYCPSSECWTYDDATSECNLDTSCVSVSCKNDQMDIFAKPEVLGASEWGTVSGWNTGLVDANGMYSTSCFLSDGPGSCGDPSFELDQSSKENIVFTYVLLQHGSDRTRSDPLTNKVVLANGVTLNTSPHGVGVTYKCWYLTTVSVDSNDVDVVPITIIGEETSTGSLAGGFTLTVGPTPIILGNVVDAVATWSVTISVVSFHFELCTVTHGAQSVNIIEDGCTASDLGVTTPAAGAYQYKTFTVDGETGTTQGLRCEIKICSGPGNCAYTGTCPAWAGYGFV